MEIKVNSLDTFVSLCAKFIKEGLTFSAYDDGGDEFTITLTGGY